MRTFNCLDKKCSPFGNHLLEASAGTGKTFAIEQVFVRLILEGIELEKILAVTFTKAATRELKARISANLEKALKAIQSHDAQWPYLEDYFGSETVVQRCQNALASFDRCQIFTIHGFCFRQLQEFAFEAHLGAVSQMEMRKPERLRLAALDFLTHGINPSLLCQEQIGLLLKEFESMEEIVEALMRLEKPKSCLCYSEVCAKCKAALHSWGLQEDRLKEDFEKLSKNYKKAKGDFAAQLKALVESAHFPLLLKEKGSIFDFLDPENRKVRFEEPKGLHYPGFFEWAREEIFPLVKQEVFPILQKAFFPIGEKILEEEEFLDPDAILHKMQKAAALDNIQQQIQKKYEALIIDEFQDTDRVQWDIFQTLFPLGRLKALYLVGDPKQSIYRFRGADVYTYLQVRDLLAVEERYHLDTNYRSSKPMIEALNALFQREWFHLPQRKEVLAYHSVQAGSSIETDFQDGKGAIHCLVAEGESLFQEAFLPYAALEIEKLGRNGCAILVKDHNQAAFALEFLQKRGIAAIAKSKIRLSETPIFQAIVELIEAVISNEGYARIMAGPFAKPDLYLSAYKTLLEEKGLIALAKELTLDADGLQIFELLFAWERAEGFSFEGLRRYLRHMAHNEEACRRMEEREAAVQIMTLHVSKGLEFDVVFALGLASRTPISEEKEEINAEKMRQLYVAMTRAKKRLYLPIAVIKKEIDEGAHSPMEWFARYFQRPLIEEIEALAQKESITVERINTPFPLPQAVWGKEEKPEERRLPAHSYAPCYLSSFTTLARTKEHEIHWTKPEEGIFTLQTMPRGASTGTAIHAMFESLFRSRTPLWRDPKAIEALVREHVRHTPLENWQKAIQTMIEQIVNMPLQGFSLSEIDRFQVEMEFLFPQTTDFIKGFIDLVFYVGGKVYFLDWKTNWLENYEPHQLEKAMQAHDYGLQASLYKEAIRRHFKVDFGGAFYVFIRGCTYTATT